MPAQIAGTCTHCNHRNTVTPGMTRFYGVFAAAPTMSMELILFKDSEHGYGSAVFLVSGRHDTTCQWVYSNRLSVQYSLRRTPLLLFSIANSPCSEIVVSVNVICTRLFKQWTIGIIISYGSSGHCRLLASQLCCQKTSDCSFRIDISLLSNEAAPESPRTSLSLPTALNDLEIRISESRSTEGDSESATSPVPMATLENNMLEK